ncbi:unnamed protein product [Trichobilharzia szidati]|nr:unnamed protein product [Trichobilharzia szidati]
MHEYPKYSHLETISHNLDPNLRNHAQSQHSHHDFVNFLTFLQSHKTSPTSSVAAHINASVHQYRSIPCFDELLAHATSNNNTYSNTSLNLKYTDSFRQGHFEDDHLSLVNFMQNSTGYIRSLIKSSGCDHLLSSYLKNNIILPSIIEQSKQNEIFIPSPLPLSSTSSVTTKVPSSVSWINQLTELYPAYTQELSVIDCIYKTFTSLLKNSVPSDNKNDENDFMFSGLNDRLNVSNIQNQINHSYFQNDTGSIYDEVRTCASNIEHPLVNNSKECYTLGKMRSKLYDNCPLPDYKSQMTTVHNKNCITHKSGHHNKLNNQATSSSSSLGFPLFNPFVESGTMGANSRKICSNHPKKCSSFHDTMFSTENVPLNPISPWSDLLNQKTNTNFFCSPINYSEDKLGNCNNLRITEQLKLYKENDSNNCVRLVNGQKKTRDDLSVSDFIASAIKYDNLNSSMHNNGALIEALASTNNLEMCWVKLVQIKENFENDICNLSSELVFIHSSKRHHLLVGISEKSGSKQASRMLWPHFNAKSFNKN